jgi:peptidoglycan-N-acetylglucosamine deacetylase
MAKTPPGAERSATICPLSLFHIVAVGTVPLVLVFLVRNPRWAWLPIVSLVILSAVASFWPRLGFYLPVTTRGSRSRPGVALTFDDGPDPVSTPPLLKLLAERSVKATFFLIGQRAEEHPELVRRILAQGHEVGNHSYGHDVFLMLRGSKRLAVQIAKGQNALKDFGVRPLAFRPPVGITNPRLFGALLREGMFCVCFKRRPADFGNRRVRGLAKRVLRRLRAGDILALHDRAPKTGIPVETWLAEVDRVISGTTARGLKPALLSEVLQKPIMESVRSENLTTADPVRVFYDSLAPSYDNEQERGPGSWTRRAERERVAEHLEPLLGDTWTALEIGAGTGRLTLPLAKRCRRVLALDVSLGMLRVLEEKARSGGIKNIEAVQGDLANLQTKERFDLVCSFSAFEYIPDLETYMRRVKPFLKTDGVLYFVTARRSLFRFFAQVGNALRQGVWLRARSAGEVKKTLKKAGFRPEAISAFGMRSIINGGLLLEVMARPEAEA